MLANIEGIDFVYFSDKDVVRHKLVQQIVAAYSKHGQGQAPDLRSARARKS